MNRAFLLPLVFVGACVAEDGQTCATKPGPTMRPGWNCLSCHRENGMAAARPWSAGGTVFEEADSDPCDGTEGVDVVFMDARGREIERVRTNAAGNFFTATPLPPGFRVAVERDGRRAMMPFPPPAGSCNACHSTSPIAGAKGLIRAP